jgi:MFS family permease
MTLGSARQPNQLTRPCAARREPAVSGSPRGADNLRNPRQALRQTAGVTSPGIRGAGRRDLALLLAGGLVSTAGSALTVLAVSIHLRPLGPAWVASSFAAELVPVVLLAPSAGALVDRVRNRELLAAALGVQALAVLAAALLGLAPGRQLLLLAALVVLGAANAVANPAVVALLPRIGGEEYATRAYGWWSSIGQAGFLVGAASAGVLVDAIGVRGALLVDAASYVVLAVAVATLRTQRDPLHDRPDAGDANQSAWAGLAAVRGDRILRVAVAGLAVVILASIVVNVAEVFYVLDDLGAGPVTYGMVTACWPLAGVPAAVLAGRLGSDRALVAGLAVAGVAMGAALAVTGAVVALVVLVVAWLVGGGANAVQNVAIRALIRSRTRDAERGRVAAAVAAVLQAANILGLAVGGAVVTLAGARGSLAAAGVLTMAVGAATWLFARPALTRRYPLRAPEQA